MNKSRISYIKPKSSLFSPTLDYFHIPLHESAGADTVVKGQVGGVPFADTATFTGSPADTVWTSDPGYFTGEGDNSLDISSIAQAESVMNPTNFENGGLLVLVRLKIGASRTNDGTSHGIFGFGGTGAAGGYEMYIDNNANANLQFGHRFPGGSNVAVAPKNISAMAGSDPEVFWIYLNYGNRDASLRGFDELVSNALTFSIGSDESILDGVPSGFALSICGLNSNGSPDENQLNNGGNIDIGVHDFWAIQAPSGLTTEQIQLILTEYHASSYNNITAIP